MNKPRILLLICMAIACAICPNLFLAGAQPALAQDEKPAEIQAIQLETVVTGLSNPLYVTNAKDGTNRLFIIEQAGRILALQPGSTTPTVFLDIISRVLSGGERGLLGLAFHPQYPINRRFFVNYTRQTDGATVIAEYRASVANPNVADLTETVLLVIGQPFANHNGGMIEFGSDGYLYIGMGDGGSGNDPGNRAQDINDLLGKMLRIDVDTPNGAVPYSSPPDNPFIGSTPGRDEIYAIGLRNPFRWSFDRGGTRQLFLGDVGQGAWEEIDIITLGGNYGWRIMEGNHCNPSFNGGVCTPPAGHIAPIAEYSSATSRCSITGGYVYRGARSAVPVGAYIFGDFCTGEIIQLNPASAAGSQTVLLDTTLSISSFGEDEAGEIYVVHLTSPGGTVSRITATPRPAPCVFSATPSSAFFTASGGEGSLQLTTAGDCSWLAASNASWLEITSARSGTGSGSISFIVRDNLTSSPRQAKLMVAGRELIITQDGGTSGDCTYTISPAFASIPADGGTGTISVFTEERCGWQAVPDVNWITITSNCCGISNGTVSFSVAKNSTGIGRKGTITIGNRVFAVKQKAS